MVDLEQGVGHEAPVFDAREGGKGDIADVPVGALDAAELLEDLVGAHVEVDGLGGLADLARVLGDVDPHVAGAQRLAAVLDGRQAALGIGRGEVEERLPVVELADERPDALEPMLARGHGAVVALEDLVAALGAGADGQGLVAGKGAAVGLDRRPERRDDARGDRETGLIGALMELGEGDLDELAGQVGGGGAHALRCSFLLAARSCFRCRGVHSVAW
ncbi:hypothetical protein D3C72_834880 [compost metagenome]